MAPNPLCRCHRQTTPAPCALVRQRAASRSMSGTRSEADCPVHGIGLGSLLDAANGLFEARELIRRSMGGADEAAMDFWSSSRSTQDAV